MAISSAELAITISYQEGANGITILSKEFIKSLLNPNVWIFGAFFLSSATVGAMHINNT